MTRTRTIREKGGFLKDPELCLIRVFGEDATRFMQSQTTNDIHRLNIDDSQESCLLDRKARVLAHFKIYRREHDLIILVDRAREDALLEHLDKFRFADRVEFEKWNCSHPSVRSIHIEGRLSRLVLKSTQTKTPRSDLFENSCFTLKIQDEEISIFKNSLYGEEGFFCVANSEAPLAEIEKTASDKGFLELVPSLLETARIEAGEIKFNTDYDTESLLSETGLENRAVSYEKGCFQGQEVLARIKSHGAPTKALAGLMMEPGTISKLENNPESKEMKSAAKSDETTIGWVKSMAVSELLGKDIAIVLMKRDYREPDKVHRFQVGDEEFEARVVLLPFYQAPSVTSVAMELYEEALSSFAEESEADADSKSIRLLREAISYNPVFEDAYESLGVILSKRGKLDEAIEIMLHLAELNPDSVMAHTNLSVFYLEKGWKEKAEEEKAISTTIQMLKAARSSKEDEASKKRKEEELKELKERLSMFEEVLEIDAEDFLANYGKGSCLVALERFSEAVEYLERALSIKPDHSLAYLELGKAHKSLGNRQKAVEVLEGGISVASRRGDMEPLKKMQELIKTGVKSGKKDMMELRMED